MNGTGKVVLIATAGVVAPASASWLVDTGEPMARFLLTCAQILVALVTAGFVIYKWRTHCKKDKDNGE